MANASATQRGNLADMFSAMLIYDVFRASKFMNLYNRAWESDFQNAFSVVIPLFLDDGIQIDQPNQVQLEATPIFETARINELRMSAQYLRGTSQRNLMQATESRAGARIASDLRQRLVTKLAIELDTELAKELTTGISYAGGVNGFSLDAVGVDGGNGWGMNNAFPYEFEKAGTATTSSENLYDGIFRSIRRAALWYRDQNVLGGVVVGDGHSSEVAFVAHPAVTSQLVEWALENGVVDLEASAGRQAATEMGILGTAAFEGRIAAVDVVSTTAIEVGATETYGYFLPTNGAVAAAIRPPMWSFSDFFSGNTGGALTDQSTCVEAFASARIKPEHLGRVEIRTR